MKKPYKETITQLVHEAEALIEPHHGNVSSKSKGGGAADLVTELDQAVEKLYAEKLNQIYPDIGFVGEEFGGDIDQDRYWLVDPIDGTAHFVRGLPFCSTMIALIEEGEVTFSAIYCFPQKELFIAEKGQGTTQNGKQVRVSNRPLKEAYVCHEIEFKNQENIDTFVEIEKHGLLMETISAGFEFAQVSNGKLDGRICLDPFGKNYDYAPGSLLVQEAGGIVRNIGSDTYDIHNYNFVAANPLVYKELHKLGIA